MSEGISSREHLSPNEVASYVSGDIDSSERIHIEEHLAGCSECASEVAAVYRMRQPTRRPSLLVAGLAAAAVLIIWFQAWLMPAGRRVPDEFRAPVTSAVPAVEVIEPAEGSPLQGIPRFLWHSTPGAVTYRLTVSDQGGNEVWSITTSDTFATPPKTQLSKNTTYFWYVDALRSDGNSSTSGIHRFHSGD